jgi:hypothetical protein
MIVLPAVTSYVQNINGTQVISLKLEFDAVVINTALYCTGVVLFSPSLI